MRAWRLRSYVTPAAQISSGSERREQRQRRERRRIVGDVLADGLGARTRARPRRSAASGSRSRSSRTTAGAAGSIAPRRGSAPPPSRTSRQPRGDERAHQYVSLPPEWSKAAPVENVMRSLARYAISSATSSARASRPIGTRASM